MGEMANCRTKPKIFYGWIVTAAASITYFLNGARTGAFGIFLKPICDEFGWSRAVVSGASSLAQMEGSVEGLVVGFLTDKFGPRRLMWIGFAIGAIGFVVLGFINSIFMFYFAYVALITLGLGATHLPAQTAVANWFIRKRSRAFAILTIGFALGSAILTPGIGWLNVHYGWRTTAIIIGAVIGIVCSTVTFFIRHRPEQYGLLPDGDIPAVTTKTPTSQTPEAESRIQPAEIDFTPREAMRTGGFWFLAIGFILLQLGSGAVTLHAIPLLTDRGIDPQAAANFVGLSYFWGLLGRLMWGSLGDFVPKRYLLSIAALIQTAGIVTLAYFTTVVHIYLYTILYGVGQGVVPVQFAIRGEYFGRKAFATIAGIMNAIAAAGAFIAPVYAGWVYDTTGTYKVAFTLLGIACGISAVFFFLARRPKPPKRVAIS